MISPRMRAAINLCVSKCAQSQASTGEQLDAAIYAMRRLGLYDAEDLIQRLLARQRSDLDNSTRV